VLRVKHFILTVEFTVLYLILKSFFSFSSRLVFIARDVEERQKWISNLEEDAMNEYKTVST
jgi:hypothetical protein